MASVEERLDKMESKLTEMGNHLSHIQGAADTTNLLIKWVILPLIVILGGLVGVKIMLPPV